jgi:predicted RNA-binding Zn ribbon-like protein
MTLEETRIQVEENTEKNYLFLSGALALDLVNTEIMQRGKRKDLLVSPQDLAAWKEAAFKEYPEELSLEVEPEEFDEATFEAIKNLRAALRHIFTALVEQHPVPETGLEELNRALKLGYQALRTGADGNLLPYYRLDPSANKNMAALLLPVALSAFKLITEKEVGRLHRCKNNRCILFFYDQTKSATRHWCSLGCMNRARSVQRYYQSKNTKPGSGQN